MYLESQRDELLRLGYTIAGESERETVAVRNVWHWDTLATNLTYVVYLQATGPLSRATIESAYDQMIKHARELDPSRLPRGFQHGRAIMPFFVADRVEPSAIDLLEGRSPVHFSELIFPAALDRSTSKVHFLKRARVWGVAYHPKFRFLAQRLLDPEAAPSREPFSWPLAAITFVTGFTLLFCTVATVVLLVLLASKGYL